MIFQLEKSIAIEVVDNSKVHHDKVFRIELTSADAVTSLESIPLIGQNAITNVTIVDDDSKPFKHLF